MGKQENKAAGIGFTLERKQKYIRIIAFVLFWEKRRK